MFQGLTKEALGSMFVPSLSGQDIDHVSVLVYGSPKVQLPSLDFHEDLVDVPDVAEASLFSS